MIASPSSQSLTVADMIARRRGVVESSCEGRRSSLAKEQREQ
jgi:hypothetical protein